MDLYPTLTNHFVPHHTSFNADSPAGALAISEDEREDEREDEDEDEDEGELTPM